ncbi:MAG: hypothetical protein QHH05_05605 [Syntrophomonadaceae bacterium]|jgi:hypothetical protein|nr:hypothetical protein [Syntrophomonadaceae bacterium]MDH7497903.1 hypothetical protein [Syntrophomonadaceae bacterium]
MGRPRRWAGIEISPEAVRVLQFTRSGPAVEVAREVNARIACGSGPGGEGQWRTAARALKDAARAAGTWKVPAVVSLSGLPVVIRELNMPVLPPRLLERAVFHQLPAISPLPVEEMLFDYLVEPDPGTPGRQVVTVIGLRRSTADAVCMTLAHNRWARYHLEVAPLSLGRLLGGRLQQAPGQVILVHADFAWLQVTGFLIGRPQWVKTLIRATGRAERKEPGSETREELVSHARWTVRGVLELLRNGDSALGPRAMTIQSVVVVSPQAMSDALVEELGQVLPFPVEAGSQWLAELGLSPDALVARPDIGAAAVALGAGLRLGWRW